MDTAQTQTSVTQGLDPAVVNLAKAIRQSESGGNFNGPTGKSGEHGAYQFTDGTWNAASQKYLGQHVPLLQATPAQQNEVAYKQIKEWKDAGYNVGQIASMWNAGHGEPNAYLGTFSNGSPSHGINKFNAHFDVPQYAKSVAETYQKLKTGGQQPQADPNNPSSTNSTLNANVTPPPSSPGYNTYGASFPAQPNEPLPLSLLKEVGNVPSSAWNLGKGLVGALMHPVKTVEGIGNVLAGGAESAYSGITGQAQPQNQQTATFNAVVQALKERYGSLDNAKRTMENDPIGVIADVTGVLAGVKGITGVDIEGAVNQAIRPLADTTAGHIVGQGMNVVGGVASLPAKAVGGTLGAITGVGYTPIAESMKASQTGGDALKAYTEGLRGGFTPEELVAEGQQTLQKVIDARNVNYQAMLGAIKSEPTQALYDITPIENTMNQWLSKFNVATNEDGTLNFSRVTTPDAGDTAIIQKIYDDVRDWGNQPSDLTAGGLDALKRRIGNFYSPTSDVRAFTSAIRKSTSGVLEDVPGYTKAMSDYADATETIDNTRKALSLGDTASVETAFKKLTSALKNNDFRQRVLSELDQETGSNLMAKIAGQRMSSIMPRGLAPYIETVGGLTALHSVGIIPLLGMALTTSPRLVGEFLRALGMTTGSISRVMSTLAPVALPTGGLLNTLVSPGASAQPSR